VHVSYCPAPRVQVRTISFSSTLPSFVSLICPRVRACHCWRTSCTYASSTIDQPARCQPRCLAVGLSLLTSSGCRGVPDWRREPGQKFSIVTTSPTACAYLLQALSGGDVDIESFPAPLCACQYFTSWGQARGRRTLDSALGLSSCAADMVCCGYGGYQTAKQVRRRCGMSRGLFSRVPARVLQLLELSSVEARAARQKKARRLCTHSAHHQHHSSQPLDEDAHTRSPPCPSTTCSTRAPSAMRYVHARSALQHVRPAANVPCVGLQGHPPARHHWQPPRRGAEGDAGPRQVRQDGRARRPCAVPGHPGCAAGDQRHQ
jgi:hypothetical protein